MSVADLGISVRSDQVKQASGYLERLTASSTKAEQAVERLGRSSATANADFSRISAGVDQANAALTKLVALGEQSNVVLRSLTMAVTDGASRARAFGGAVDEANNSLKRFQATNDNMARFRRQNLTYQLFDVGQMAALGQNPAMTLMQQGPQIAQLYAGQGGVNAALRDAGTLAGGLVTKLWPVGMAAAAGGLAIRGMQDDIGKLTGKTVTFGDTASQVFGAIKDDILAQLKPVIDDVAPWFNTAWDTTSSGAVTAAEIIINSFRAAYVDIEYLWSQFPNMMGSLVTKGLNAMIGGIQTMIQTGASYIDAFLAKINAALDKADALLPGKGYRLGTIGTIDFGPPLPDQYSEELSRATEERNRRVNEIMTSSPLRDYYKSIRDRAAGNLEFNLPNGGAGGKIPIPGFRGVDDIPGDQEYLQDFQKKNEARIRQLEDQKNALGLTGVALEAFRIQQEAVNAALSANIELTPEQLDLIKKQAAAYGQMAEALAKAKLASDLAFERNQLGRNDVEQAVAGTLKQYGLGEDLTGPDAALIRSNELLKKQVDLWKDIRKGGMDAYSDIFDLALDGFDNWEERLSDIAKDMAKNIFDLSVKNPFLNEQYGANLPTMDQAGGLSGFFGTMLGLTPNPATGLGHLGTAANPMYVVQVGGLGGEGGIAGTVSRLLSPANSNLKASDYAPMSLSGIGSPAGGGSYGSDMVSNIRMLAGKIGANPRDLAALMSFESGMNPSIWGGSGGNYYGLIQAGANERKQYGITPGGSLADQFGGIERFFKDRGFKPGMTGAQLYSTVNTGNPFTGNRSDAANGGTWGSANDKWNFQMGPHFAKADALLSSTNKASEALDNLATKSVDLNGGFDLLGKGLMGQNGQGGILSFLGSSNFKPNTSLSAILGAPQSGSGGGGLLDGLFGWIGKLFGFADGTENAPAGWAWVGERGPELRKLRAGDVIRSNPRSMEMAANARGVASSKTEMHFHNAPAVAHQQESDDGEGGKRMDIWFEQQTAKATSRRGSAASKALASMGLTRPMKVR